MRARSWRCTWPASRSGRSATWLPVAGRCARAPALTLAIALPVLKIVLRRLAGRADAGREALDWRDAGKLPEPLIPYADIYARRWAARATGAEPCEARP